MTEWKTGIGQARSAWVAISFNNVNRISGIELQQPKDGHFKELKMTFSSGRSQLMRLSDVDYQWNNATISPPVDASSVNFTAIDHYKPEELNIWFYRIREIRFRGIKLAGNVYDYGKCINTLSQNNATNLL